MKLGIAATSLGGGFFGGIVIGYALKKVGKLTAIVLGMFLAGIAYLQYQATHTVINASQNGIPAFIHFFLTSNLNYSQALSERWN
jgi:uncharacterized membrane protein (Fun14 family)